MANYNCPLCNEEVPRDLVIYLDHTNGHILEKIKEKHPEWTEKDGTCTKCRDYYEQALKG